MRRHGEDNIFEIVITKEEVRWRHKKDGQRQGINLKRIQVTQMQYHGEDNIFKIVNRKQEVRWRALVKSGAE